MTKININLENECKEIERYEVPVNYHHRCPLCGSSETVRNGTYVRNIVFIKNGKLCFRKIKLQRFLCKSCMKTRTHYPWFMASGREYSLSTIFHICTSSLGRIAMAKITDVPVSQIRRLRLQYKHVLKKIKTLTAEKAEINVKDLVSEYMRIFNEKPFEGHQRNVSIIPSA